MGSPITSSDIAVLFGRELTDMEQAAADLYIDLAVGEIESWLGRPVGAEQFVEVAFPDADGAVYFLNTPVISLDSFTINGSTYFTDDSITVFDYGIENVWELTWPETSYTDFEVWNDAVYGGTITVTYTAGLDWPGAVRSLVVNAVMQKMIEDKARDIRLNGMDENMNVSGVKSLRVEDYEIAFQATGRNAGFASTSSVAIFPNPDVDFKSIRRLKRIGVK